MKANALKKLSPKKLLALHNKHARRRLSRFVGKKSELIKLVINVLPEEEGTPKYKNIMWTIIENLCHIDYHYYENKDKKIRVDPTHKEARSKGISYEEILKKVLEDFPYAGTSLNSIRWYARKIKEETYPGYKMPYFRPQPERKKRTQNEK